MLPPSPPSSCMPCDGSARFSGDSPSLVAWSSPPPPSPTCHVLGAHAAQGVPRWPPRGSGLPPSPACRALGSHTARGVVPSYSSWFGEFPPSLAGMPCAGSARCRLGGFSPFLGALPLRGGCARPVPHPPSFPHAVCARCWGWGGGLFVLGPASRWVPALPCSVFPHVPPLRDVGARCWVGDLSPPPPLGGRTH